MSKPVNHHYVPQYYLRYFKNREKKIFVYDKESGENRDKPIKKVASEKNFHTLAPNIPAISDGAREAEEKINKRYENKHAPHLKKVVDILDNRTDSLYQSDKNMLAEMIAIQLIRVPRLRTVAIEFAIREKDSPGVTLNEEELIKGTHINLITSEPFVSRLTNHFSRMTIWFLKASHHSYFITSDCPVITAHEDKDTGKIRLTYGVGIGVDEIQIYFPLSPEYVMVLFKERDSIKDLQLQTVDPDFVSNVNKMTFRNASKVIFSHLPLGEAIGSLSDSDEE